MSTGMTTNTLIDSIPFMIDNVRMISEFGTMMTDVVDTQRLPENSGTTWDEDSLGKLTATSITETTELTNFQDYGDTLFSIEPVMSGIATFVTDRAERKWDKRVAGKRAGLMQNAIMRRIDTSLLALLDTHSRSFGSAGVALNAGYVRAAKAQNATGGLLEPWNKSQVGVFHSYQAKFLADEQVSPIGTYPVPSGMTEDIFRKGFSGLIIDGVVIMTDDNFTLDSGNDVKGAVFARGTGGDIVHVVAASPYMKRREAPQRGGGGTELYLYEESGDGLRASGQWGTEMYFAADAPTS